MAFKYVTPEKLQPYLNELYKKGLRGEELREAGTLIARDLDYKLHKAYSTTPLFVKSLGVGTTDMLSNTLRGLGYVPGLKKPMTYMADALQEEGAFGIKGATDPYIRQDVTSAMEQPVLSKEYISAGLGHLTPNLLMTLLAPAKWAGTPYALATFFGAQGTGRTDKMLREMGVPEDKIAPRALAMGGVEALTSQLFFKNIARGWSPSKSVLSSVGNILKTSSKHFAKDIAMMGGTAALESEVQDKITKNVLDVMAREDPGWKPAFEYHKPSTARTIGGSLLLGAISKTALSGIHNVIGKPLMMRKEMREASVKMAGEVEGAIKAGVSAEKAFGMADRPYTGITAPAGIWSHQKNLRAPMSLTEAVDRVNSLARNDLVKLATKMKVGSATTPSDILRQRVVDNLSNMKEGLRVVWSDSKGNTVDAPDVYTARKKLGTMRVKRTFVEETPKVEPAAESTTKIISNVNKLVLKYLDGKVKSGVPEDVAVGTLLDMQLLALRRAGLSVSDAKAYLAKFRKTNTPPALSDFNSLSDIGVNMTQSQASRYLYMLNGAFRRKVNLSKMSRLAKHVAMNEFDANMFKDVAAPPFNVVWEQKSQQWVDNLSKEYPRMGLVASYFRPMFMQLVKLQNKIPALPFLRLDNTLMERTKKGQMIMQYLTSYMHEAHKDVPEQLVRGVGGKAFRDLIYYMMTTGDIKHKLASQKEVPNAKKSFVQKVIEASKTGSKYSQEQVKAYAQKVADKYATLFRWLGEANGLDPKRMIEQYAPIFYEFSQKASTAMSFSEYIEANKKDLMGKGFDDVDFENMKDLDSLYYANKHGQKNLEHTPGFLLARKMDNDMLEQIGNAVINSDIDTALERYIRGTTRRLLFNDTVPVIEALYKHTNKILTDHQIDPTPVKKLYDNYLASMFSIESPSDKILRTTNIRTDLGVTSKVINGFAEMWNKHFGHVTQLKLFGKPFNVGGHYIPDKVNIHETVRGMTDWTFAYFLGLPFGWRSPIKNVATQNVMAGVTGMSDYVRGVMKALDPKNIERYNSYKLRMDMHNMLGLKEAAGMRSATDQMLSLFAASDMMNVYASAGVADVIWDRVSDLTKKNPRLRGVSMEDFNNLVSLDKKINGVGLNGRDVAVKNPDFLNLYRFGKSPKPFRGLSVEMYDAIQHGRPDVARKMLTQFMVNISQWRYSHGGNPAFMNMKAFKPFFVFGSWGLNNLEYMTMFGPRSGMFMKQAQVWTSQIVIAAILAKLGLSTHKWILGGNIPEMKLAGPFVDTINDTIRLVKSGSEAGLSNILPVDEEKRRRSTSTFSNMLKKTPPYELYDMITE